MAKRLLSAITAIIFAASTQAQEWSATLSQADGLPGIYNYLAGADIYYTFGSETFTPGTTVERIRLTVVETLSNEQRNGDIYFALSELAVFDGDGNKIGYTATSNADHNSLSGSIDGDGLYALSDNDISTYFHSYWGGFGVGEYHHIEMVLERPTDKFRLEWSTRAGQTSLMPTTVGITLGTEFQYTKHEEGLPLGDAVMNTEELAAKKQLFVLKGNAADNYTTDGMTFTGNGPLYMQIPEEGNAEPNIKNAMQLIPAGNDRYILYWPAAGKYLKNSADRYNGSNGWQESTAHIEEAAYVKFTSLGDGNFEMQYDAALSEAETTLFIGAEARTNTSSKMKTFDLEHKNYLEEGDYTKGYSLPIAFNWNIYKADIDEATVGNLSLQMYTIAQILLNDIIYEARIYLLTYGDFNGYCNGEETALYQCIYDAEELIAAYEPTFEQITNARNSLLAAFSRYMAVNLNKYIEEVESTLATSSFSDYPYKAGTYPTSSKSILENILTTISDVKENATAYSASYFVSLYAQIESEIEMFRSTIITEDTTGGESNTNQTEEYTEIVESEYIYLYLKNGGVEAYAIEALDGDYYTEGNKIYFPLKDGDVEYFTKEEYDSCSTVAPEMPELASFKFNNKYNPNLHIDAIADTIKDEMHFSLNSIGKWLTASFTLSDEKAIAYVDTIPQESKVTRQDFTSPVTYTISRPDCYILKRVKTTKIYKEEEEDEAEDNNEELTEIPLSADNMYTNKPSNSDEGLDKLLDGDPETIFHSTYGNANNATLNVNAYITIGLPYAVENIKVYYRCRNQRGYNPLEWEIYASKDGEEWIPARTLNYQTDNMPTGGKGQEYTSPAIDLGDRYSHIKILQTQGEYSKNHLAISELRLYEVIENEEEKKEEEDKTGSGAREEITYKNVRMPLGNEYKVSIDWLTDRIATVPRIDIDIEGGKYVTSKDYYLNACFRINGYGIYEDFEDSVQIKGRGNTSWSHSKKPYRLKFEEKVKPFGLTKGKSWVLLANAQKGSLMANAVAMKVGQMAGSQYANHIIPVELYMNGTYMGSYMFTEKVGMANNSVDIDEDQGYLLELDTYFDEAYKFRTFYYDLPVNVKEPDLSEYDPNTADTRLNNIQRDMDALCRVLNSGGDIEEHLDMDAYVRFYLANDLALNQEIGHPKSTFLFKENENDPNARIKFGPIWDFDWGFGYENSGKYCYSGTTSSVMKTTMSGYGFLRDITSTEAFKKHYYKVWKEFLEKNSIDELMEYIDSYYTFAERSFQNNTTRWGSSNGFYTSDRDRLKEWLQTRKEYIYSNLDKIDIDDILYTMNGDASSNNQLTIHDVALISAYINGITHETFSTANADCNGSGRIDLGDMTTAAELVMDSKAPNTQYWSSTPMALGEICTDNINFELNKDHIASLEMSTYTSEAYNAFQFDIVVPAGIFITDIKPGASSNSYRFSYKRKSGDTYRVVAYSDKDEAFSNGTDEIAQITFSNSSVIAEEKRHINITNAYIIDSGYNELRINDHTIRFDQEMSIKETESEILISGGEYISITTLEPVEITVYSTDGRKIHTARCKNGTTHINVPAGIYIINNEKVTVK